jgi:hypothetical protein
MRKNKNALVTVSSKGIARPITLTFAKSREYSGIITNSRKIEYAEPL